MTGSGLTVLQSGPQQSISQWIDRFRELIQQGLAQDQSTIDGVRSWVFGPTVYPQHPGDPGLWQFGLQYRPVAIGILLLGCVTAAGMTLSGCQQLRKLREKGHKEDLEPIQWMWASGIALQNATAVEGGKRILGSLLAVSYGAIILGLAHYYLVLVSPGIRNALRVILIDTLLSGVLLAVIVPLLFPIVGAPVAYLYTLYRAARAL